MVKPMLGSTLLKVICYIHLLLYECIISQWQIKTFLEGEAQTK